MKFFLLCLTIDLAVSTDSVERNLMLDTTQQARLQRKLAMQQVHDNDGMSAAVRDHTYQTDEELGTGASRLEVLEVRNELEEAKKEIRYQTSVLKGVMAEVNDLESDYARRLSLLSKNRETASTIDEEISEKEACTDMEPYPTTCEAQRLMTDACEQRRSGRLNDGYCAQTCGLCQVSDFSQSAETPESSKGVRQSHVKSSGKSKFLEKVKNQKKSSGKSAKKTHLAKSTKKTHSAKSFGRLSSEPQGPLVLFLLGGLGFAAVA